MGARAVSVSDAGPGRGSRSRVALHSQALVVGLRQLTAKPAGVCVIEGKRVSRQPAVDVNRVVLGGQVVVIVAMLVLRSVLPHC